MQSLRKRPWMFTPAELLIFCTSCLCVSFCMNYGCWTGSQCSLVWDMVQCFAPSRTALILLHLPPGLWGQSLEWVGGWEKDGDWGSKSTCFRVWCTEPESIWFCCVYTIWPAGANGSALAITICWCTALTFPLVPTLFVQRESEWDPSA